MLPTVGDLLTSKIISDVRLLQKYIAVILFIVQNLADGLDSPDVAASRGLYFHFHKSTCDGAKGSPFRMPGENHIDNGSLVGNDLQGVVGGLLVSVARAVIKL